MYEKHIIRGNSGRPVKASGRYTAGRLDMFVIDVEYRTGPPLHTHAVQEDTFYVIEGVMTVQLGDEVAELGPGDFASAPPGVPHTFENADAKQKTVRMVNVMTPGIGFDRFIEQFEALQQRGAEATEVERLGQEYGAPSARPLLRARTAVCAWQGGREAP